MSSPVVIDGRPTATDSQIAYFDVNLTPSLDRAWGVKISVSSSPPPDATALAVPVASGGEVPSELGFDRAALAGAGFEGKAGQTLVLPRANGATLVALGVGDPAQLDVAAVRDGAAAFARATAKHERLAVRLVDAPSVSPEDAARAVVEGVMLARYRYDPFQPSQRPSTSSN